jgi:hypothetical protein
MSMQGDPLLDQERVRQDAIRMLRSRAEQFRQMAATAVTKKVAVMLTTTSRGVFRASRARGES